MCVNVCECVGIYQVGDGGCMIHPRIMPSSTTSQRQLIIMKIIMMMMMAVLMMMIVIDEAHSLMRPVTVIRGIEE